MLLDLVQTAGKKCTLRCLTLDQNDRRYHSWNISVAFFFTAVALYLSSAGQAEYKIAFPNADSEVLADAVRSNFRSAPTASTLKSCGRECINPKSNETYRVGEICIPGEFNKTCADCPEVQCQFTKYVKAQDASWMQWYNLFGLYWGMFFASALRYVFMVSNLVTSV